MKDSNLWAAVFAGAGAVVCLVVAVMTDSFSRLLAVGAALIGAAAFVLATGIGG